MNKSTNPSKSIFFFPYAPLISPLRNFTVSKYPRKDFTRTQQPRSPFGKVLKANTRTKKPNHCSTWDGIRRPEHRPSRPPLAARPGEACHSHAESGLSFELPPSSSPERTSAPSNLQGFSFKLPLQYDHFPRGLYPSWKEAP